jgi:oxalate decarboxylase/phosphoglucose isomerase-like protein (cupin superfamily)
VVFEAEIQFVDLGDSWRRDERGFVYFPFQNLLETPLLAESCASCHLISIEPGHHRGQHQHPGKTEWLLVFHGEGELFWRSRDTLHQRRLTDNHTLVVIPPGIPHTLRNDGSAPLFLLAWRAAVEPGGDEPDTVSEPLL